MAVLIGLFILSLFIMITVHEFGHFLACRWSGIVVEEFSIGMFGPRLLSMKRGDTIYAFRPVLLGAFVKPTGESDPEVPGGLASRRPRVRFLVFMAGPVANILLAFVIFVGFFLVNNEDSWVEHEGMMIYEVSEGWPAAEAGLQPGDFILSVDGENTDTSQDLQDALATKSEGAFTFAVWNGEETREVVIEPQYDADASRRLIGATLSVAWGLITEVDEESPAKDTIRPGDALLYLKGKAVYSDQSLAEALASAEEGDKVEVTFFRDEALVADSFSMTSQETVSAPSTLGIHNKWAPDAYLETKHYPAWQAPVRSAQEIIGMPSQIVEAIPFIRENPDTAFVGPVGAGQLVVETVSAMGFSLFLYLAGLISIGLALFNFIPVPPLDGGGMLVAFIEGIRGGRRLSARATSLAYTIGTVMMITLFVAIMFSDLRRLIEGESFFR